MLERFVTWLNKTLSPKQAALILALCMLIAAAFGFGAVMGQRAGFANVPRNPPPGFQAGPPFGAPPPRGTFGSIDQIDGDVIQMRDPRSGRTWRVRTGSDTVIEAGPRGPIPFKNLRVGQRIFVVGMPNQAATSNEFDAQFIGVVLGQQQRYVRPVESPVDCLNCTD
jgi:hypothetical protein